MKTNAQRKDIREKDEAALVELLTATRESMRKARFGKAGTPGASGKSQVAERKLIARLETELRSRKTKTA
jgi:ribosomal protein L29